jgi:flavin reductase (DIM6/NTAB) family NADH-FMN oxidoreductase RutF
MSKIAIGPQILSYPMPVSIVGANVDNKPNYLAVAWFTTISFKPPLIAVTLGVSHHTNAGIKQNGSFSVNVPSAEMAQITDYCGLVSGRKVDKSNLFESFYGKLKNAPMIAECPLAAEARLVQTVTIGDHEIFIGEIEEIYTEERFLTNGALDVKKIDPLLLTMPSSEYWTIGERIAAAWSIGKEFKFRKAQGSEIVG